MKTRALIVAAMVLSACHGGGGNGGGNGSSTELRSNIGINLSHVVGFVVSQPRAARATPRWSADVGGSDGGTTTTSQLYALNQDDSLTIVTVTTSAVADGGSSTSQQTVTPLAVFDTRLYVFLMYEGVTHAGTFCDLIGVRKADGAMYCIPGVGRAGGWKNDYWNMIQSDASGQIVWVDNPGTLSRLDLTNPDAPTLTQPLSGGGGPFDGPQAVNADGDDLISTRNGDPHAFTRVLKSGGGFIDVAARSMNCVSVAVAADPRDFYFLDNVGPHTTDNEWVQLVKSSSGYTRTKLASATWADCSAGLVRTSQHFFLSGVLEPLPGGGTSKESNQILVFAGATPKILSVAAFAGSRITRIAGYEQALFVLGTDTTGASGIVKYEIAGGAFTTLLAPGDYNVSTMDVSPGGDLTFYGQRASDGAFILGNVAAGSTTPSVIATGFPTVTQIARIN